ncbi:5-formyltetrahydrofolate cyclo-ligase [Shewanella sp. AS1]|uniref:5-formyltetrahydrofolate cyclo-ligase n=1 Tax=Shewanella sp. AS1 TaxID=2907626 RepID=UPI001F41AA32|nr:5-formyltetrahydrofolate cyclo-ligase [Shewanella sp. AS1]MCE9679373.1 5-formyltetrahydrofolate cyclo-ligase [Shewanella sp. AS1]
MNSAAHSSARHKQIQSERQQLRQQIRQARRQLSAREQREFAELACQRALELISRQKVKRLALYLTNDGELDTQPLIEALWQREIEVYLPRLHPFSPGNLIFLRYQEDTQLQTNSLKIREPKLDIKQMILPHQLDLVITPLVAFDSSGQRMGMGGGFYDRTLANWQQSGKPLPIGYAHDCQKVSQLKSEYWDVPLPMIITPSELVSPLNQPVSKKLS